jgi:hypothetical protein
LMNTKLLLTVIAVGELLTGLALLIAPSVVVGVLLGATLDYPAAIVVGRVAGAALLAIGLICWLQREIGRGAAQTGLLVGLLAYNAAVPIVLAYTAKVDGTRAIGLWPAVVLHSLVAIWCVASLLRAPRADS